MQQHMYKTKICDVDYLQKRLMQTWFGCEQNVIKASIDSSMAVCIMWFIRTFYETVNVIWCIWGLLCS